MLKLHSSDSELEFTGDNKSSKSKTPNNVKSNKKRNRSKKKNQNQSYPSNNISKPDDLPEELPHPESSMVTNSPSAEQEQEPKKSGRKQVGSSFENNTEKLGTSSSEEDECSGSSSSDEGVYGYGKQAIGIDPTDLENFDGNSEPLNGSQYLMMVMSEKRRTPKIAVSSVERKQKTGLVLNAKYAEKFEMDTADPADDQKELISGFTPTQEWRNNNLQEFSLLRCKVERLRELLTKKVTRLKTDSIKFPDLGNKVVWLKFCFGIKFEEMMESRRKGGETLTLSVNKIVDDYFANLKGPDHTNQSTGSIINPDKGFDNPRSPQSITTHDAATSSQEGSHSEIGNEGRQPLMSLMLVLTQQQIERLIYFQSDWLSQCGFMNRCQGEWLYALLACIDKPVEPSTMGDIRNICKTLIAIRNKYCVKAKEAEVLFGDDDIDKLSDDLRNDLSLEDKTDDISAQANEYLNAVNLFIYLIADYFCQKDLVD